VKRAEQLPLNGIRVLDLSRFVSGPFCAVQLPDLGAQVIKVESPGTGDGTRRWGEKSTGPDNPYFLSVNRGKKSVELDFNSAEDRLVLDQLVADAHVVLHNLKPSSAMSLGLDFESIRALNATVVYCDISGFGGESSRPAFDFIVQAASGMMSVNGEPEGEPLKLPFPLIDVATSLYATVGILSGLLQRALSPLTGPIEVSASMFDVGLAIMPNLVSQALITGQEPKRLGNVHPTISPYEPYEALDGWIAIGVATEPSWKAWCAAIGHPGLATEERFATNPDRLANRRELYEFLKPIMRQRSVNEWLDVCDGLGIPASRVASIPQALTLSSLVHTLEHPAFPNGVPLYGSPIRLHGKPLGVASRPPRFSEHTGEVKEHLWNSFHCSKPVG
jgi:crotonobetainyl-CoA:carnitine CoA-transferase CaiB-like acyl-CoA transferase